MLELKTVFAPLRTASTTIGYKVYYNGHTFYKVQSHTDQRRAQVVYGYDETDANHGGSGFPGLMTSVTRIYLDGSVGSGVQRTEKTKLYYDGWDRLSQSTDQRGVTEYFAYNARHQLTRQTHAFDGTHVDFTYDDNGNRLSAADELAHTTFTAYDEYRRVTSVTVPVNDGVYSNRITRFSYDRRDTSNNVIGAATRHTSSAYGVSWLPSGKGVQRVFSYNGWLTDTYAGITVPNNDGVPVRTGSIHSGAAYSATGKVHTVVDAESDTTSYTYDVCDRLQTTTDPTNNVTTMAYYAAGEAAIASGGNSNCAGLLKSVTKPGTDTGNHFTVTTQYANYDVMGRLLQTIDPYSTPFNSNYDVAGDLTRQTDGMPTGSQHHLSYSYDQLGRKTQVTDPVTQQNQVWTYDASGNLATFTNYAGNICTYQYNGRNQSLGYSWNDSATSGVTYVYNAANRLREVDNVSSVVKFTYDDAGAVLTESDQPVGKPPLPATTYTRDADGNVTSLTYPNGNYPCFAYDNQERCTGMYSGYWFSHYYYSGDRLSGRWLGNRMYTSYGYQANGRVNDLWSYHVNSSGVKTQNVSRHLYGYEPDGQISWFDRENDGGQSTTGLENGNGDAFTYWPDGSLQTAYRDVRPPYQWPGGPGNPTTNYSEAGSTFTYPDALSNALKYTYDAAGNRSQVQQTGPSTQNPAPFSAQGNNEYVGSNYDGNNNTINSQVGWTYRYDAENKLLDATPTGSSIATVGFAYDGLGRLMAQVDNSVFTYFYYAGAQRIEERDSNKNLTYLYFFDTPGSDQMLFRQDNSVGRLWYQTDLTGNTTQLSWEVGTFPNCDGQVVEQYTYDTYGAPTVYDGYGNVLSTGSTCNNRYLYKSSGAYEWLPDIRLFYCRARFYLPVLGRFLQPDPIGQAGGLNIYTYCHNDPINGIDPDGLEDNLQENPPARGTNRSPQAIDNTTTAERVIVTADPLNDLELMQAGQALRDAANSSFDWRHNYRVGPPGDVDKVFQDFANGGKVDLSPWVTFGNRAAWTATTMLGGALVADILEGTATLNSMTAITTSATATGTALQNPTVRQELTDTLQTAQAVVENSAEVAGGTSLSGPQAAQAALGRGDLSNPGAPLTEAMRSALQANASSAQYTLNQAQQGLNRAGNPISSQQVSIVTQTMQARLVEIQRTLDSGVQAPKK